MVYTWCVVWNLVILGAFGFHWVNVDSPSDVPDGAILHRCTSSHGWQYSCRARVGACGSQSGRVRVDKDTCRIPNNNEEHVFPYGEFEVAVSDDVVENFRWISGSVSADYIKSHGAVVDLSCATYICANSFYGPGKLKIWSDSRIVCYVASGWEEYEFEGANFQMLVLDPANRYHLTNVDYNLDELSLIGEKPLHLATATFINKDDFEHDVTHILKYKKSASSQWENSLGFKMGTSMTIKGGIPLFASAEWSISQERSFAYKYGESFSESVEISLQATVTVPPRYSCDVSITARQLTMDVPYTATLTTYFEDGTTKQKHLSGIYSGLTVSDDTVQIEKCIPLSSL